MRRCSDDAGLRRGYAEAQREAEQAFGNPALYLEKLIVGGRHVEFQVLCDGFGNAIHLGERECSIQRQHQKLVEEAPSPVLDAETRRKLGNRVARAVAATGYRNAGTVEFLRSADGDFYFMEMNTRLQVEHPVTEMLTGVDIVEQQLRIAAMAPLTLRQRDVRLEGHALEFRINAENPSDGFRPDPGRIEAFEAPRLEGPDVQLRWDSAIREGYRIPPHYDSLIGKLIVGATDRPRALDAARSALESLRIEGIHTTIPLHLMLLDDPTFRSGNYDIDHLGKLMEARTS